MKKEVTVEKSERRFRENFNKSRRGMSILYFALTAIVLAVLIGQFYAQNYENCFTCILTLFLFLIPAFVDRRFKITLPNTLEVLIILFIFAAEILGEIREFYLKIPWWDTMLHTANGFLMAAIGISMIDIFNQSEFFKFELSPFFVILVAFCFSMTIGVLWEFFEFLMDTVLRTDMQKDTILQAISTVDLNPDRRNIPMLIDGIDSVVLHGENLLVNGNRVLDGTLQVNGYLDIGLKDTMQDLLVNFVGAVLFSFIGFFYIKNRGKGTFAKRFIPRIKKEEGALQNMAPKGDVSQNQGE